MVSAASGLISTRATVASERCADPVKSAIRPGVKTVLPAPMMTIFTRVSTLSLEHGMPCPSRRQWHRHDLLLWHARRVDLEAAARLEGADRLSKVAARHHLQAAHRLVGV